MKDNDILKMQLGDEKLPPSGVFRRSYTGAITEARVALMWGAGVSLGCGSRAEVPWPDFERVADPATLLAEDDLIEQIDGEKRTWFAPRLKRRVPFFARVVLEFAHDDGDVLGLAQVLDKADALGVGREFDLALWLESWRAA